MFKPLLWVLLTLGSLSSCSGKGDGAPGPGARPAGYCRQIPRISRDELLTKVQQQTFKYFWDFGHPASGLSRERNTSGDIVTSGGTGFGVMAIIVAVHRQFITRAEGLARLKKMTTFLRTKAVSYHGAYPHWLNGASGATIPFSANDDGADLVETSYLIQGCFAPASISTGRGRTKLSSGKTSMRSGATWNGISSARTEKTNSTGIGAPAKAG